MALSNVATSCKTPSMRARKRTMSCWGSMWISETESTMAPNRMASTRLVVLWPACPWMFFSKSAMFFTFAVMSLTISGMMVMAPNIFFISSILLRIFSRAFLHGKSAFRGRRVYVAKDILAVGSLFHQSGAQFKYFRGGGRVLEVFVVQNKPGQQTIGGGRAHGSGTNDFYNPHGYLGQGIIFYNINLPEFQVFGPVINVDDGAAQQKAEGVQFPFQRFLEILDANGNDHIRLGVFVVKGDIFFFDAALVHGNVDFYVFLVFFVINLGNFSHVFGNADDKIFRGGNIVQ